MTQPQESMSDQPTILFQKKRILVFTLFFNSYPKHEIGTI
jgi:hypothetical protein